MFFCSIFLYVFLSMFFCGIFVHRIWRSTLAFLVFLTENRFFSLYIDFMDPSVCLVWRYDVPKIVSFSLVNPVVFLVRIVCRYLSFQNTVFSFCVSEINLPILFYVRYTIFPRIVSSLTVLNGLCLNSSRQLPPFLFAINLSPCWNCETRTTMFTGNIFWGIWVFTVFTELGWCIPITMRLYWLTTSVAFYLIPLLGQFGFALFMSRRRIIPILVHLYIATTMATWNCRPLRNSCSPLKILFLVL